MDILYITHVCTCAKTWTCLLGLKEMPCEGQVQFEDEKELEDKETTAPEAALRST